MARPASIPVSEDPYTPKILTIATLYEELLGIYENKTISFLNKSPLHGGSKRIWKRAIDMADSLGVDYLFFLKANFYFFNLWFKKYPTTQQLVSAKSIDRVNRFKNLVDRNLVDPNMNIRGPVIPTKPIPQEVVDLHDDRILELLIKGNPDLTTDEIIVKFARCFSKTWLEHHDCYLKSKQ